MIARIALVSEGRVVHCTASGSEEAIARGVVMGNGTPREGHVCVRGLNLKAQSQTQTQGDDAWVGMVGSRVRVRSVPPQCHVCVFLTCNTAQMVMPCPNTNSILLSTALV